jgi:hypothetical protein
MPAARQTRAIAEPKSAAIGTVSCCRGLGWVTLGEGGCRRTQDHDCLPASVPIVSFGRGQEWNGRTARRQGAEGVWGQAQRWPPTYPQHSIPDGLSNEPDRPASSHARLGRRTSASCSKPHASQDQSKPCPPMDVSSFLRQPYVLSVQPRGISCWCAGQPQGVSRCCAAATYAQKMRLENDC